CDPSAEWGDKERTVQPRSHFSQPDWKRERAEDGGQNRATPQTPSCDLPKEDDPKEESELFITLDEPQSENENKRKRRLPAKRKRDNKPEDDVPPVPCDLDQDLDRALEDRATQHNLTAVNVRNILHEVITNEHVVAMMKAAITETEGLPPFEPKMTRSKLKEVVEKGVVIPTWNLSPIKKVNKAPVPQFVDIPLEEEDSSDEEYQPEEEDEEETAEESLLESDVESTASSPRGSKRCRVQHLSESQEVEVMEIRRNASLSGGRHIAVESTPMGPPPPPKAKHIQDSTFMEKLNAVDEELDWTLGSMDSYQSLDDSLIAFRTRSKRPLKDVPIGQLEAKLKAPDITPDMYDHSTADDEDWKLWLHSLMQADIGNEDEGDDDDDDPEYNILDDLHLEPDTEDLRNDRAVRITKKEVNQLMEELFETFQDEMGISHLQDEGPDEEDSNPDPLPNFNTPQAIRFEEPLANLLTEQHRSVRAQLEYIRMRKSMMKGDDDQSSPQEPEPPRAPPPPKLPPVMALDEAQRKRLQQQMQQHVQLLTQLHLMTYQNPQLASEAQTTRMYLVELSSFAESSALTHAQCPGFQSAFLPCNLKEALQLIPLVHSQVPKETEPAKPPRKNSREASELPKHVAWVMASQPLFMYPELLPVCSMRAPGPRDKVYFTKGEDNLLALGLRHFEGTDFPKQLISKYLLTIKTARQLIVRLKNLSKRKMPDNIIEYYKKTGTLPPLSRCCDDVPPQDRRPPLEKEKHKLPFWIKASLGSIETFVAELEKDPKSSEVRYPVILPPSVTMTLKPLRRRFYRRSWRQRRPSVLKPLLIRPSPAVTPKAPTKPSAPQTLPFRIVGQVPPLIQPAVPGIVNLQQLGAPAGRRAPEICIPVSPSKRPFQAMPNLCNASPATHLPVTQGRMIMPATANPRLQKPLLGGFPKRKPVPRPAGVRATSLLQTAPMLFTLPSVGLKLVSLGAAPGVLHSVGPGGGSVTAVLLNAAPAPLSQTLISPPFSQTLLPVVPEVEICHADSTTEESAVKSEGEDWEYVVQVKDEEGPACAGEGEIKQDGGGDAAEDMPSDDKPPMDTGHPTDVKDDGTHPDVKPSATPPCDAPAGAAEQPSVSHLYLEPPVSEAPQECAPYQETDPEPTDMEEPDGAPEDPTTDGTEPQNPESVVTADSPKNASPSTDGDVEMSSPSGAPCDVSSPPDGQEGGQDKEALEEEEDFDDLTQDEDEMSSASEESVLSVPELQETMEKLTWLASERRLSQEGDSEENSQEENTEEEEEEEGAEGSAHKPQLMTDETGEESEKLDTAHQHVPSPAPVETSTSTAGERRRVAGTRVQSSHRTRNRRGRARASKDASKLLLLYDDKILLKDPLREQKDMAYAQSYLTRVQEALQPLPGSYERFLSILYEFEMSGGKKTAMDLYESLRPLLQDWPQLLKDFAAFLPPEQALECGLFEEQQAFEKSRRFLRQLEICFLENPMHHQKIIKLLQSCAECPLMEMEKLKTQMLQLLRGHHHLQEEFSLFFEQLRPPASRMDDFEVLNWTEDKEYKFDGFEEVTLPEVDEEDEPSKGPAAPRSKRRKEPGPDKDTDWPDGGKDCPCTCHDGGAEARLKRCKRRLCAHCSGKTCYSRARRSLDTSQAAAPAGGGGGDVRSPLMNMAAEERGSGRLRSALHGRAAQGKDGGRAAPRASRRPHPPKDPLKDGERSPASEDVSPISPLAAATCEPTGVESPSLQSGDGAETLTMCAKNIKVSSSGEKVILWTREADRVILTTCQEQGAHQRVFAAISSQLGNKSPSEVAQRFRELVNLFQTSCVTSSEEEEEEAEPGTVLTEEAGTVLAEEESAGAVLTEEED
ncbi:GON-4-like protein, partial [Gastrophryne carolinensis]